MRTCRIRQLRVSGELPRSAARLAPRRSLFHSCLQRLRHKQRPGSVCPSGHPSNALEILTLGPNVEPFPDDDMMSGRVAHHCGRFQQAPASLDGAGRDQLGGHSADVSSASTSVKPPAKADRLKSRPRRAKGTTARLTSPLGRGRQSGTPARARGFTCSGSLRLDAVPSGWQ